MRRRLVDAAAEMLCESGYSSATVQRICERAGVSQGALFRHFATKDDLMAAVGVDVSTRTLAAFSTEFAVLRGDAEPLPYALALVRQYCRSDLSLVWLELALAARTRPQLRAAMTPVRLEHHAAVVATARELLPQLADALGDNFAAVVEVVISAFDGERVEGFVAPRPQVDEARLEVLVSMIASLSHGVVDGGRDSGART